MKVQESYSTGRCPGSRYKCVGTPASVTRPNATEARWPGGEGPGFRAVPSFMALRYGMKKSHRPLWSFTGHVCTKILPETGAFSISQFKALDGMIF